MPRYFNAAEPTINRIVEVPDGFDIDEIAPDLPNAAVIEDDDVQIGWSHADGVFSPPAATGPTQTELLFTLKAEAGRVISAVVGTTAQLNLNAAMNVIGAKAVSARSADENAFSATFAEGYAWIQAVRARVPELLEAGGVTPEGEARWPEPSQAVRDLAALY